MRHKYQSTKMDIYLTFFFQFDSRKTSITQGIFQFYIVLPIPERIFIFFLNNTEVIFFAQKPVVLVNPMTVGPGYVPSLMEKDKLFSFWYFLCFWSFSTSITDEGRKYFSFSIFNFRTLQR